MGVDYDGNYGVGYNVIAREAKRNEISEGDIESVLAELIEEELGNKFKVFEVGAYGYDDEYNDVYVVIKDAFKDGLDLSSKKKELDTELKRLKLEAVGEFGEVGGLHVW